MQLTRKQLERQREGVEAQKHWAVLHGGDQELLDLLEFEIERLFVKIGELPRSPIGQAREAMLTAATRDSSLGAERQGTPKRSRRREHAPAAVRHGSATTKPALWDAAV